MSNFPSHVQTLFATAMEKESEEEQIAYLDEACMGDLQLRERVLALLRANGAAGSFLGKPPAELAATAFGNGLGHSAAPKDESTLDFLSPCTTPGRLGSLGSYEIAEVVGQGGMGIVLKGHDPKLNRVVAIKVLAPHLAVEASARRRFLREAQAAAAVSHDHVVTIYAIDDSQTLPFLVMEYISGQSLQQRIDRSGALELKEILRIGKQMALGLSAAHDEGLIHRDVKPANILLENGVERVKITDFGLARAVDDASITKTGVVAGTPEYMSPEQAQGLPVDHRSDLFSLGCVLYAMCTGHSPFRADSSVAALRRVCDDTPRPVRDVNAEVPRWLTGLIDQLLEKNTDKRPVSASEIGDFLGAHLARLQCPTNVPMPETPSPFPKACDERAARPSRRFWRAAAVVLLLLCGALFVAEATGVTAVRHWIQTPDAENTPTPEEGSVARPAAPSNWALTLDGEDDHVALPLRYDGSHPLTVEAWIQPQSENPMNLPGIAHMSDWGNVVACTQGSGVGLVLTSRPGYAFWVHNGDGYQGDGHTRFLFGEQRTHLAGVFDGDHVRLFVNGELVSELDFAGEYNESPFAFLIGGDPERNGVARCYKGAIEQVRFSKVARYSVDFVPEEEFVSDKSTWALYSLNEGGGDTAYDTSGNRHHGAIRGARWVPGTAGKRTLSKNQHASSIVGTDLLSLVDAERDSLYAPSKDWRLEGVDDQVLVTKSEYDSHLQIPYSMPKKYRLAVDVERISSDEPFGVGLFLDGELCFADFDVRSENLVCSQLRSWNGESFDVLSAGPNRQLLEFGKPASLCCVVGGAEGNRSVEMICDGERILYWEGQTREIPGQFPPELEPKTEQAPILCNYGGVFRITELRTNVIEGKGRPVFSAASAGSERNRAKLLLWSGCSLEVTTDHSGLCRVDRLDQLPEEFCITGIDARRCYSLGPEVVADIVQSESLERLVLRGQRSLSVEQWEQLLQRPLIKVIDLANTATTDTHIEQVGRLPRLEELDMSFTQITNAGLASLNDCRGLHSLTLTGTNIDDSGLAHVVKLNLRCLNLCGTRISNQGIKLLSGIRTLEHLNLDHVQIDDVALVHLGEMPNLAHLSLNHTLVSDSGLEQLSAMKHLTSLSLVSRSISQDASRRLCESLPQCQITHCYSAVPMLPLIDTERDSLRGHWSIQGSTIVSPRLQDGQARFSCLQIPFSPPKDYVLEAVVQRASGNQTISLGAIVDGHLTSVRFDTYPALGCLSGIGRVDGRFVWDNHAAVPGPMLQSTGVPKKIIVTVRGSHITASCGNRVAVDWQGATRRLSVHPNHSIANPHQLFLGSFCDAVMFSDLKVTPIITSRETRPR